MIKKKCTKDTQPSAENTLGNLIKTQETSFIFFGFEDILDLLVACLQLFYKRIVLRSLLLGGCVG